MRVQGAGRDADAAVAGDLAAWVDRQQRESHPRQGQLYQHKIPTAFVHASGMHSAGMPTTLAALRGHIIEVGGHAAALSAKRISARGGCASMTASLFEQVSRRPAPPACGIAHLCLWLASPAAFARPATPSTCTSTQRALPLSPSLHTAACNAV